MLHLDLSSIPEDVRDIALSIFEAGGKAFLVGGWVRDQLLGASSKDYDFEVYNLSLDGLEQTLQRFGEIDSVGKSFGVLRIKNYDIDFSLPRTESKVEKGHKGFRVVPHPNLDIERAALRRDLTINSMSVNMATGELVDPYNGLKDIEDKKLQFVRGDTFVEDPLRALRVAQFIARLGFTPTAELTVLCQSLDLSELPGERLQTEFDKLLLKGQVEFIQTALEWLVSANLLRFFPELEALVGTQQDPIWHPEGNVWVHTLMVVEEAAKLRTGNADHDKVLMYGALCHDLGKPATTTFEAEGQQVLWDDWQAAWQTYQGQSGSGVSAILADRPRIRSRAHEAAGVKPTQKLLGQLMMSNDLIEAVCAIVEEHLAPHTFLKNKATPKAFRRLARKLGQAGTSIEMLHKVATADHFGRATPDAFAREYPAGDWFLNKAGEMEIKEEGPKDIVMGRHLIARGWTPGPQFGPVLDQCREVQYETGWTDPDQILDQVLVDKEKS